MNYSDLIKKAIVYFTTKGEYEYMRSELSQRVDYIDSILEEKSLSRQEILNYLLSGNFNVIRIDLEITDERNNPHFLAERTGS